MTVTKEINEYDIFNELWSGARDTLQDLNVKDIKTILDILDTGEPMDLAALNDFFWFNRDTIAGWLSYKDYEELLEDRSK